MDSTAGKSTPEAKRFAELIKLIPQGDAETQYALGDAYALGNGVKQNYKIAAKWFCRAAEQGHLQAQSDLAMAYLKGRGVKPDSDKALGLLHKAADKGHALSLRRIAYVFAEIARLNDPEKLERAAVKIGIIAKRPDLPPANPI